ncbi:MAG TPA: L,D-transpeptidase family protein [Caulobacteraceae bacterium]|jgi:murein L,D-transpeptidase YcbB/YkuD
MSAPVLSTPSRRVVLGFTLASLAACHRPSDQPSGQRVADPLARRFYAARGWRGAWDRASSQAMSRIVAGARAHGLDPAAFAPKRLAGLSNDEALTVAALAYAKALATGFVEPHKIERIFTLAPNKVDVAAGLSHALDHHALEGWYASLAPQDAEYRALSAAYLAALSQTALASAPANGAPVGSSLAPTDQARQLAANLERRRWLSRSPPAHRIDVNTAGAFLGYLRPGQAALSLRTVVGRDDNPTPSLEAAFHQLVANPPWRVPADIAEKEILPKGDAYMAGEDMHMEDGRVVQAPGPKSALGLVKFDVEDPYDIYLHDTPAKALFAQDNRHRSHGCVRVEDAVALARKIAAETGKAQAFDQALASQATGEVELGQSIPVRLLYHTAYLDQSGKVLLARDVYGTDDQLAAALGYGQASAAARQTEPAILFGP